MSRDMCGICWRPWDEAGCCGCPDNATSAESKAVRVLDDDARLALNNALCNLAARWTIDGDWMTCKACKRSLIASRANESLSHAAGCKLAEKTETHPWRTLLTILRPLYLHAPADPPALPAEKASAESEAVAPTINPKQVDWLLSTVEKYQRRAHEAESLIVKMRGQWIHSVHRDAALAIVDRAAGLLEHPPSLPAEKPSAESEAPHVDIERLVADCVPGGEWCEPQAVADAIRAWEGWQPPKETK